MTFPEASDATVLFAVLLARLAVPLLILRFPLPAIFATIVLDAVDQPVVAAWAELHVADYQTHDKALDLYYLTIAYISTIRNWARGALFSVARALLYYRLAGVVLFEYFEARWLLVVFPNVFEYFFVVVELVKVARNPFGTTLPRAAALAAVLWAAVKLPQEWWIHVAQLDTTDVLKERGFGAEPESSWAEAIGNRPLVAVALAGAAAVLAGLLRLASRLLPPGEWPPTWSADVQARHLGWPDPGRMAGPGPGFGWAFAEKIVLITLVTATFVRILPAATASIPEVALGATAVVAATTLLSHGIARRGVTSPSSLVEFLAVAAVNGALVLLAGVLIPRESVRPPLDTALFLIGLLSVMVVLFDRAYAIGRDPARLDLRHLPGPSAAGGCLTRRAERS